MGSLLFASFAAGVVAPTAVYGAVIDSLVSGQPGNVMYQVFNEAPGNGGANTFSTPNSMAIGMSVRTRPRFADPATPLDFTLRVDNRDEPATTYIITLSHEVAVAGGAHGLRIDLLPVGFSVPGLSFEPVMLNPNPSDTRGVQSPSLRLFDDSELAGSRINPTRIEVLGAMPETGRRVNNAIFGLSVPYFDDPTVESYDFTLRFTALTPEPASAGLLAVASLALLGTRRR